MEETKSSHPTKKMTVIGGGIAGAMEVYFAHLAAKRRGEKLRVTMYEKNKSVSQTTVSNIVPSLTPDEITCVVPRGQELVQKLKIPFHESGGIRVDDVFGVEESSSATDFICQVQNDGQDEAAHQKRTDTLLKMGALSMEFWKQIYDTADPELRQILLDSNFNPCYEPSDSEVSEKLHNGYRIDLIYNEEQAKAKAAAMVADYQKLEYKKCKLLSPAEVVAKDPFLADFCEKNSENNKVGERVWKKDAVAIWRPGGCIDTQVFLPKFFAYLQKAMGTYTNAAGKVKDCFRLKYDRNVEAVAYSNKDKDSITGLRFFDSSKVKENKHTYQDSSYVFCPGENVGELSRLGFAEPSYAGFAGASLMLHIPIPPGKRKHFETFNHCMEVHQPGVVLAWQARRIGNQIFIGVAGTKAFYADKRPHVDQAFARDRNLLQLNMINDVLPECISMALGRNTKGQYLGEADLLYLEHKNLARRWVGTRAVTYDGFPTLGPLYHNGSRVHNARCTTHLGSGGASFSPAAVFFSQKTLAQGAPAQDKSPSGVLAQKVLQQGVSTRIPRSRL